MKNNIIVLKILLFKKNLYNINIYISTLTSLVQLVEHRSPKPGVEGSSPSGRVIENQTLQLIKFNLKCNR